MSTDAGRATARELSLPLHQPQVPKPRYALPRLALCSFWNEFTDWGEISSINFLAGTIAYLFALVLWATSINWARRKLFEVSHRCDRVGETGVCNCSVACFRVVQTCTWLPASQRLRTVSASPSQKKLEASESPS